MAKICSLVSGVARIVWGIVFDRLGFRIPYGIVTINQIIVSSTFYFAARNKVTFFIVNVLEYLSFSGHGTIASPIVTKIFGMKNALILLGITGYFIGTAGFLGALMAKLIIKKTEHYIIIYYLGAALAIMATVIAFCLDESKFQYTKIESKDVVDANTNEQNDNNEKVDKEIAK